MKVLIIPHFGDSIGHINRCIYIGERLDLLGYSIKYLLPDRAQLNSRVIESLVNSEVYFFESNFGYSRVLRANDAADSFSKLVDAEREAVSEISHDVIVADMGLSTALYASPSKCILIWNPYIFDTFRINPSIRYPDIDLSRYFLKTILNSSQGFLNRDIRGWAEYYSRFKIVVNGDIPSAYEFSPFANVAFTHPFFSMKLQEFAQTSDKKKLVLFTGTGHGSFKDVLEKKVLDYAQRYFDTIYLSSGSRDCTRNNVEPVMNNFPSDATHLVSNGGYASCCIARQLNMHALTVPYHHEHYYNGMLLNSITGRCAVLERCRNINSNLANYEIPCDISIRNALRLLSLQPSPGPNMQINLHSKIDDVVADAVTELVC